MPIASPNRLRERGNQPLSVAFSINDSVLIIEARLGARGLGIHAIPEDFQL